MAAAGSTKGKQIAAGDGDDPPPPPPEAKKKVALSLAEVGRILSWVDTRRPIAMRRRPSPEGIISEGDCRVEYQARIRAAMDSCGKVMVDEDFVEERKFRVWEYRLEEESHDDYVDYDSDDSYFDWDEWFPYYLSSFTWLE
uniref:Uncharacterized protein n=1 Tax=Leersia perrieri TaxID=77586 RepID=A0A0D9XU39_9ORYZ